MGAPGPWGMRPVPTKPCLGAVHAFEGDHGHFEATRTLDPAGNYEIGWSHKLSGPDDPLWDAQIDASHADALALEDLNAVAAGVCDALGEDIADSLTEGQYVAVLDFSYNLGAATFAGSTLCHFIKTGAMHLAPLEFAKWVYAHVNGVAVEEPGLVRRRAAELAAWRV